MAPPNENDQSAELESQVVNRLRAEGLIARENRPASSWGVWAAILVVAVVGLASLTRFDPEPQGQLYVLALYAGEGYRAPSLKDRGRAMEYGRWANLHGNGPTAVIGGEELEPTVATLGKGSVASNDLVGFFTVRARSKADAVALARTTPHLRYGGIVTIRPVAS